MAHDSVAALAFDPAELVYRTVEKDYVRNNKVAPAAFKIQSSVSRGSMVEPVQSIDPSAPAKFNGVVALEVSAVRSASFGAIDVLCVHSPLKGKPEHAVVAFTTNAEPGVNLNSDYSVARRRLVDAATVVIQPF